MQKHKQILLTACIAFLATGCGSFSIAPREVHSAAGVPRSTMLDDTPKDLSPTRFALGASLTHGSAMVDTGKPQGATTFSVDFELRATQTLALGLRPFYADADGNFDADHHFGTNLYVRWRVFEPGRWALSLYPNASYARNHAIEHGQTCVALFSCANNNTISEGDVELVDVGLGLIPSYYPSTSVVLSLIPTVYFTHSKASYSVAGTPKFSETRDSLNFSLVFSLGYLIPLATVDSALQVQAGVATLRGMGPTKDEMGYTPVVHLGYQISLGPRVGEKEAEKEAKQD